MNSESSLDFKGDVRFDLDDGYPKLADDDDFNDEKIPEPKVMMGVGSSASGIGADLDPSALLKLLEPNFEETKSELIKLWDFAYSFPVLKGSPVEIPTEEIAHNVSTEFRSTLANDQLKKSQPASRAQSSYGHKPTKEINTVALDEQANLKRKRHEIRTKIEFLLEQFVQNFVSSVKQDHQRKNFKLGDSSGPAVLIKKPSTATTPSKDVDKDIVINILKVDIKILVNNIRGN